MRVTLAIALLPFLVGCSITQYSGTKTEPGTIEDTVFAPSQHGTGIGNSIDMTDKGGIGLAIVSVDVPEKYATVFRCPHGKFIIEGKALWKTVKPGDIGTIYYREVYRCDRDGSNCHLEDYDFLRFEKER